MAESLAAKNDGQVALVSKAATKINTAEVEESKTATDVTEKSTAKLDNEEESN